MFFNPNLGLSELVGLGSVCLCMELCAGATEMSRLYLMEKLTHLPPKGRIQCAVS